MLFRQDNSTKLTLTFLFFFFSPLDEAGPSSLPSASPLLKKSADLSSRKVRRHVLQLTQRWKTANTNLRHRLKVLQRVEKVRFAFSSMDERTNEFCFQTVNDLRSQCDQVYAHLSEIDLAFAQQNQRRTLTIEQIPPEIEQTKVNGRVIFKFEDRRK